MKVHGLLLLCLLTPGTATSQNPSAPASPPDVAITKVSWRKDIQIPALLDDPMDANQDHADQEKLQKAVQRANVIRARQGQTPLPPPPKKISGDNIPPGPTVNFVYEAKVKNIGAKTIQAIEWEYVVSDPSDDVELGRRKFTDVMKLRPGKEMTMVGISSTHPVRILRAKKSDKDPEPKYVERVVINRIEFSDGTFWQRPVN